MKSCVTHRKMIDFPKRRKATIRVTATITIIVVQLMPIEKKYQLLLLLLKQLFVKHTTHAINLCIVNRLTCNVID